MAQVTEDIYESTVHNPAKRSRGDVSARAFAAYESGVAHGAAACTCRLGMDDCMDNARHNRGCQPHRVAGISAFPALGVRLFPGGEPA